MQEETEIDLNHDVEGDKLNNERARSGSGNVNSGGRQLNVSIPRAGDALRRAKASASKSARSAKQKMIALKKNNSGLHLTRKKRNSQVFSCGTNNICLSGYMYKRRSGVTGLAASLFHQSQESKMEKKFGGRLWILRFVVLQNGVISYYEVDPKILNENTIDDKILAEVKAIKNVSVIEETIPSTFVERGSIDLTKSGVQIRMSHGHGSTWMDVATPNNSNNSPPSGNNNNNNPLEGFVNKNGGEIEIAPTTSPSDFFSTGDTSRAPSPFQMEIVYNSSLNTKECWTLCTTTRHSLFKWNNAILNVIFADSSILDDICIEEEEEEEEEEVMDEELEGNFIRTGFHHDYLDEDQATTYSEEYEAHENDHIKNATLKENENGGYLLSDQEKRTAITGLENKLVYTIYSNSVQIATSLCFSILMLAFFHHTEPMMYIVLLTFVNLLIIWKLGTLNTCERKILKNNPKPPFGGGKTNSTTSKRTDRKKKKVFNKKENLRIGGSTLPFVEPESMKEKSYQHCWTHCDDSVLSMRIGPDYKQNKQKAPTKPSLFKTVGVDLFESDKKIMDVGGRVVLPFEKCVDANLLPETFPRLLIMNFQLPRPSGTFSFGSSSDGPGYNFVVYSTPTEALIEGLKAMETGNQVEPAIVLLKQWFDTCEQDVSLKERLKLVGYILNPDECGMPNWTQSFNGKPVLVKKSGVIKRRNGVFEMDIDLRLWGFMARKGIGALLPHALQRMEFIVSFVIEGQENDELPERSMVATQISYLDKDRAVPINL